MLTWRILRLAFSMYHESLKKMLGMYCVGRGCRRTHRKWNNGPNRLHWPVWPIGPLIPFPVLHSTSPQPVCGYLIITASGQNQGKLLHETKSKKTIIEYNVTKTIQTIILKYTPYITDNVHILIHGNKGRLTLPTLLLSAVSMNNDRNFWLFTYFSF